MVDEEKVGSLIWLSGVQN